jgi:uridine kinase
VGATVFVGIAGGTASGKTTLADKLAIALPAAQVARIQHDWYYLDRSHLSPDERVGINFDEPAALDNALIVKDLKTLGSGTPIECPQYDFATHTRRPQTRRVEPRPIVIVEGILIFCVPTLRDCFDLRLFVEADDDVRVLRRIRRDLEERGRDLDSVEAQYLSTVRPMHSTHVVPSRRHAHVIIPAETDNPAALNLIVGYLKHSLAPTAGG